MRNRLEKANKLWQKGNNTTSLPDLGELLSWLIGQIETWEARAKVNDICSKEIEKYYMKIVNYILPSQNNKFIPLSELTEMAINEHFRLKLQIVENDDMINDLSKKCKEQREYIKILENKIHRQRLRLSNTVAAIRFMDTKLTQERNKKYKELDDLQQHADELLVKVAKERDAERQRAEKAEALNLRFNRAFDRWACGSEFHNDPERIAKRIADIVHSHMEAVKARKDAEAERDQAIYNSRNAAAECARLQRIVDELIQSEGYHQSRLVR